LREKVFEKAREKKPVNSVITISNSKKGLSGESLEILAQEVAESSLREVISRLLNLRPLTVD